MVSTNVDDLSGIDLFGDLENFMVEISDNNDQVIGGISPPPTISQTIFPTTTNCGETYACL